MTDNLPLCDSGRESPYCDCGACGESPCCSPLMCKEFNCKYPNLYTDEYESHMKELSRYYNCLDALGVPDAFTLTEEQARTVGETAKHLIHQLCIDTGNVSMENVSRWGRPPKAPFPMWRTVYEHDEDFCGYQCLNCKETWTSDTSPSEWLACPKCLVRWKKEWTKKNPRYALPQDWRYYENKRTKLPEWIIYVYVDINSHYRASPDYHWKEVYKVNSFDAQEVSFDFGNRVLRGAAGHLKLGLHCTQKQYQDAPLKIVYYDKVNPGKIVKTYV